MKKYIFLLGVVTSFLLTSCGKTVETPPPESSTPTTVLPVVTGALLENVTPVQTGTTEVQLASPAVGEGQFYDASGNVIPPLPPEEQEKIRKELSE